jgi:DNA-binding CsgD family transcriptional regulator
MVSIRRSRIMLSKLDLSTPDVVEFISDFDALIVLEALRRAHAIASPRQLEGTTGLSAGIIETHLARLASFGLVRRTRGTRGRVSTGYSTSQDPLVLTFDPADPQSALRTATVRLSLLSHAARIAAARSVARTTVGVLPMDAKQYASLMRSHDRVDESLAAAKHVVGSGNGNGNGNGNGRAPRYRVQMSVEPVASGTVALPTVMLMQRAEAGRMAERQERPALRDLSTREREVAEALGAGSTKREIAEKLGVKFSTINTLVTRIYRKLSVTRRAQLVNIIRNGG